jgi:hypothetical protein
VRQHAGELVGHQPRCSQLGQASQSRAMRPAAAAAITTAAAT